MYVDGFRNTSALCKGQTWFGVHKREVEREGASYLSDKPSLHHCHGDRTVIPRVSRPSSVVTTHPKMTRGYKDMLGGGCLLTSGVYADCVAWET
jgi:hypothetical protein